MGAPNTPPPLTPPADSLPISNAPDVSPSPSSTVADVQDIPVPGLPSTGYGPPTGIIANIPGGIPGI